MYARAPEGLEQQRTDARRHCTLVSYVDVRGRIVYTMRFTGVG